MNTTQTHDPAELQPAAAQEIPTLVEELAIDELAVREEYAACYCPGK